MCTPVLLGRPCQGGGVRREGRGEVRGMGSIGGVGGWACCDVCVRCQPDPGVSVWILKTGDWWVCNTG